MFYGRTAGEETAAAWFKDPPGGDQDEGEATKYQSAFRLGLSTLFFGDGEGGQLTLIFTVSIQHRLHPSAVSERTCN